MKMIDQNHFLLKKIEWKKIGFSLIQIIKLIIKPAKIRFFDEIYDFPHSYFK